MSKCRVVDLKELGVDIDTFEKIYSMGEEDGRADAIKDFANRLLNNEVIDKSVIRRVSEQMQKGKEIDKGNND